jgi:hypothetical protein
MTVVFTEEVTLQDIDEALMHVFNMLKTDIYGDRMDWRKKEMLQTSLDDLLDARINMVKNGNPFPEDD